MTTNTHFYNLVMCINSNGTILEEGKCYELYINAHHTDTYHVHVDFADDEVFTLTFSKSEVNKYFELLQDEWM